MSINAAIVRFTHVHLKFYCMQNVNLIKNEIFHLYLALDLLLDFFWFILSNLINVECLTKPFRLYRSCMDQCCSYIFFNYYLLIFLDVLFETISH